MDFEKLARDFEKRFCKKCEKIIFCGMPLTVLKGAGLSLSAALSVGGGAALAVRRDGRFTAEFDDNKKYVSENVADAELHKAEPMLEFLTRVKTFGASLGGADILFEYNTGIYNEYEPLLLTAMYRFCRNMPPPARAALCLSDKKRNMAAFCGVKDTLLLSGKMNRYVKFRDGAVKIVLCHTGGENEPPVFADEAVIDAANLLASEDYRSFGELITREYSGAEMKRQVKKLFEIALEQGDALGLGIAESGGIFAIVENRHVNAFVQNLKRQYENYCGASPDFYITRTESSGIYGIRKGLR